MQFVFEGIEMDVTCLSLSSISSLIQGHASTCKHLQAPAPEDFLRSIIITVSYSLAGMTVIRTERILNT